MLAARFHAVGEPLAIEEVPDPEPGPWDVVVRVDACGICASDLHAITGELPLMAPPPLTMGHEASGTIVAVGDAVQQWKEGDRVSVLAFKGCHTCERCAVGLFDDCRRPQVMGIQYDGAWAELVVTPWYSLAAVPEGVPAEHAAIACDAVSTPWAALIDRGGLRPGESVGLWGIGGLGTHAVQIARLAGAGLIVAVDPIPEARERALALGADVAFDPSEDVPRRIREAGGGRGLDLALDLVGKPQAVRQALDSLSSGGRVVVVGQSPETIDPAIVLLSFRRLSILGHLGYGRRHLREVLDLMGSGRLDVSLSITDRLPLQDVNEGVARLMSKEGAPVRLMVMPNG